MKKVLLTLAIVISGMLAQAQDYTGMNGTDNYGAMISYKDGAQFFSLKLFFENSIHIAPLSVVRVNYKDGSNAICNVDVLEPFGKEVKGKMNIWTYGISLRTDESLDNVVSFTLVSALENEMVIIDKFK
jgi:hypothetical protein